MSEERAAFRLTLLHHEGHGIIVEDIPDGLNLGKDQPALRGCEIDGNHKDHEVRRRDEIAENRGRSPVLRGRGDHGHLQGVDPLPGKGAYRNDRRLELCGLFRCEARVEIDLVEDTHHGYPLFPCFRGTLPFVRAYPFRGYHNQEHQVCLCQDRQGLPYTEGPEITYVVDSRRVDEDNRADGRISIDL